MKINKENKKVKKITVKAKNHSTSVLHIKDCVCPQCGELSIFVNDSNELGTDNRYFAICDTCHWRPNTDKYVDLAGAIHSCDEHIKNAERKATPACNATDKDTLGINCPHCRKDYLILNNVYNAGEFESCFVACNNCYWTTAKHNNSCEAIAECIRYDKEVETRKNTPPDIQDIRLKPFVEMEWVDGKLSLGKVIKSNDIVGFYTDGKLVGVYYMTASSGIAVNLDPIMKNVETFKNKGVKLKNPINIERYFHNCISPKGTDAIHKIAILSNNDKEKAFWDDVKFTVCKNFDDEKREQGIMPSFHYEVVLKKGIEMCHIYMYSKLPSISNQEVMSRLCEYAQLNATNDKKTFEFEPWMLSEENLYYVKSISYKEFCTGSHNGSFYGYIVKRLEK